MIKHILLGAIATSAVITANPAFGQASDETTPPSGGLEEITVVARKREESAQDVPVVVTAFDTASIQRKGIANIEDISMSVAGLSLQAPGNPTQNVLNLRGIESGSIGVGFDQPVSINIDGVQFSNSEFLQVGQFDLERIEVLKGPQSLFFGKNSPAGVISIKTANPTKDLFVQLRGGYETGTNKANTEGIISGPLTEGIGARLAFSFTDSDGYWKNLNPASNAQKMPVYNEYIIRGTLRAELSNALTATAKFTYQDFDGTDGVFQDLIGCRADIAAYAPLDDCKLNRRSEASDPSAFAGFNPAISTLWSQNPYTKKNAYIGSLELNYDLSENVSLTSLTGWNRLDNKRFDNLIIGGAPGLLIVGEHQIQDSLSEELRLAGSLGNVNFMIGAFFDDRRIFQDADVILNRATTPFSRQVIDGNTWSLFSQFEFKIVPELTLSVGGRYTNEKKRYSGFMRKGNGFVVDGVTVRDGDPLVIPDPKINEKDFSPEITLSYKPNNDILLYGAYKEGFKSGSFGMSQTAVRLLSVRRLPNSFLNESVTGFEGGIKSEWFDNSLRVNIVAFDYKYRNLQLSAFDPAIVATRVVNAGGARTRGVELESLYAPPVVPGMTLSANIAYLDGRFTNWFSQCNQTQIQVTGRAGGCDVDVDRNPATNAGGVLAGTGFEAQDRSGDKLRSAPSWTVQLGANYDRNVTSTLRLNVNGNATWTSEANVDILGDPRGINPDRWILNGGLGVSAENGSWAVDIIGRNLTNKIFKYFAENAPFSGGRAFTANPNPPRSIMFRLTLRPSEFGK